MYQFELLTNFNTKKTNQNSSSARTAAIYPEPEFSYNDVLQDELFRSFRQRKRNTSNNSRNNTTPNSNINYNTSSRSVSSSHGLGIVLPSNYPSSYPTDSTSTSNFSYDKESLMDWIKKLIEERTVKKGDANGDGVVDLNDLKTMVDRMFDDTVDVKMKNVDFNGDGKITLQDISEVIKLLVKPEEKVIKGDVNDDGVVDNKDLITLVKYLHDKNTKINFKNADIDDNGEIKLDDVSELIAIINRQKQNTEPDVPVEPDPPKKEILKGDVNGDGKVTQADVYTLNQYYVGNTTNIDMDNADMNDDGRISLTDIDRVQNLVNKLYPDMGDVNDDGVINQKDAEAIKSYRMGYNVKINMDKADMDGDGEITMADISRVQQLADELDPRVLKGDANDDGKVNYKDVDLMLKKLQGRNVKINMDAVDMNDDNDFDMKDLVRLRNLVLEQEEKVQTLRGDSNGDGVVDQRDYDNVQNFINDVKSSEDFILKNSDINGDGKIDDEDLKSLRNLTLNDDIKINYSERTHLGDVNGDGIISIADAQAITNYNNHRSTGKEFYINNADVNNDGKIDKEDVTAITDLLRNVRTVARELPVWSNVELTNKNGDIVRPGDNVIFLERENDSYKIQYKTASGEEKIGWVHRFVFDPIPDPDPDPKTIVDPPFTSGRAIRNTQAWNNPELTIPYSDQYEGLFAGETFKVKAMTLDRTAFQVEYDSIYGGTKTRWVKAEDIQEYIPPIPPPTPDPIPESLQILVDYWTKKGKWKDNTYLSTVSQCKEFASYIFDQVYGVGYIGGGSTTYIDGDKRKGINYNNFRINLSYPNKVKLVSSSMPSNVKATASTIRQYALTEAKAREIFKDAQSGDFVQMRRENGGPHSAILTRKNDQGVWFLEANYDGHNSIKENFYTYDELANGKIVNGEVKWDNIAMSIYRAK